MSRDRLSWKNRNRSRRRQARHRRRQADPYQMNVDRQNPPVEDYMVGDPSAWAESPVDDLERMDETERNPMGMGEWLDTTWDHKDVEDWDSEAPYDNADTFEAGDNLERESSVRQAKVRLAKMQRHFEKKALQCIRIAKALFPKGSDALIEEQALDLMPLPDDAVIATALRLAEDEEEKEEEENGDEEKEASLTPDQMLRQMLAEEEEGDDDDEEEEEEEEEEESKESKTAQEDDEEEDDDEEEEEESKESNVDAMLAEIMQEAGMDVESMNYMMDDDMDYMEDEEDMDEMSGMGMDYMEDEEDLDAMMADMARGAGDDVVAELGIDLQPALDDLDSEALLEESDDVLQQLMQRHYSVGGQKSKKASRNSQGVSQLGRVKEAASTGDGDNLSKLWKSAPDVSAVFNNG